MKNSVLIKFIAVIILVIAAADTGMLIFGYNYLYPKIRNIYANNVKTAAQVISSCVYIDELTDFAENNGSTDKEHQDSEINPVEGKFSSQSSSNEASDGNDADNEVSDGDSDNEVSNGDSTDNAGSDGNSDNEVSDVEDTEKEISDESSEASHPMVGYVIGGKDDDNPTLNPDIDHHLTYDELYKSISEFYTNLLETVRKENGLEYLYIIYPVPDSEYVKYIAVSVSDHNNIPKIQEIKKSREIKRELFDEEKRAMNGEIVITEVDNEFGHVLTCYCPCYDSDGDVVAFVGADVDIEIISSTFNRIFTIYILATIITSAVMIIIISVLMKRRLLKPAKILSIKMRQFTTDHKSDGEKVIVKGKDEFAQMANAYNVMIDDIENYIANIDRLNTEQHKQETELNIAKSIQSGLLPDGFCDIDGTLIRATMKTAKNVGGDFFDHFRLDDGRIFICIADVSGKGVSAALFMSRAITILRQFAKIGYSPEKILELSNKTLCSYNPNMMFVTVFIGFYDPETKCFTYSNGGHNPPYLLSKELITLDNSKGAALGLFDNEKYTLASISLKTGDTLFLFTDGVNEAENGDEEFFGTDKLEEILSSLKDGKRAHCVDRIMQELEDFAGDAQQSDDITMISLTAGPVISLRLYPETKNLEKINKCISDLPDISDEAKNKLMLIAEEVFVNICSYAFDGEKQDVDFTLDKDGDTAVMIFKDSGKQFDPPENGRDSTDDYDIDSEIGGLGIFMTKSLADNCSYDYSEGKNILTVTLKLTND